MPVLAATHSGCMAFCDGDELRIELPGRQISALTPEPGNTCLAVVDEQEICRRDASGAWSRLARSPIPLQSLTSRQGTVFAGGLHEPVLIRLSDAGRIERVEGFNEVPGRHEWLTVGPPLAVRSLTTTADGATLLAAVHVGGIPRSSDRGRTWTPTIPVLFDVHEVSAHPSLPHVVAAACAVGLCISQDAGEHWELLAKGLGLTNSLAVTFLSNEALFSIQDGPFAKRSQIWRWPVGAPEVAQVRDGLPEWLEGKVDTAHIAASNGKAAILDGAGNLWFSQVASTAWKRLAEQVPYCPGIAIV